MTETASFHEAEVERILCRLQEGQLSDQSFRDWRWLQATLLDEAQIHATLALSLRQAETTAALRAVTHRGAILTHQRGT